MCMIGENDYSQRSTMYYRIIYSYDTVTLDIELANSYISIDLRVIPLQLPWILHPQHALPLQEEFFRHNTTNYFFKLVAQIRIESITQ